MDVINKVFHSWAEACKNIVGVLVNLREVGGPQTKSEETLVLHVIE